MSMGLIDDELQEVNKLCQHVITGSKLVSCVQTMVRVEIRRTAFKHIVACIQFPSDYPRSPLLIELKSKTLSDKLLDGLTNVCEQEAKKILGKPQEELLLMLEDVPILTTQEMWLQQVGAPRQFDMQVTASLNKQFPDH
ncbi:uncharacterized protein LOC110827050 [Zootermopsis nevadensis]|uniref:uncharacterized protein LOC110827050 n=1 Tax=Zootermopsis nevadensis TaxID=136037 RepID=UPI000B8E4FAB|nr:uncharacterized protein LOC110827050 [Zootermopsis nevadensis]